MEICSNWKISAPLQKTLSKINILWSCFYIFFYSCFSSFGNIDLTRFAELVNKIFSTLTVYSLPIISFWMLVVVLLFRLIIFHKCSVGFKSGEMLGQNFCFFRNSVIFSMFWIILEHHSSSQPFVKAISLLSLFWHNLQYWWFCLLNADHWCH